MVSTVQMCVLLQFSTSNVSMLAPLRLVHVLASGGMLAPMRLVHSSPASVGMLAPMRLVHVLASVGMLAPLRLAHVLASAGKHCSRIPWIKNRDCRD